MSGVSKAQSSHILTYAEVLRMPTTPTKTAQVVRRGYFHPHSCPIEKSTPVPERQQIKLDLQKVKEQGPSYHPSGERIRTGQINRQHGYGRNFQRLEIPNETEIQENLLTYENQINVLDNLADNFEKLFNTYQQYIKFDPATINERSSQENLERIQTQLNTLLTTLNYSTFQEAYNKMNIMFCDLHNNTIKVYNDSKDNNKKLIQLEAYYLENGKSFPKKYTTLKNRSQITWKLHNAVVNDQKKYYEETAPAHLDLLLQSVKLELSNRQELLKIVS